MPPLQVDSEDARGRKAEDLVEFWRGQSQTRQLLTVAPSFLKQGHPGAVGTEEEPMRPQAGVAAALDHQILM